MNRLIIRGLCFSVGGIITQVFGIPHLGCFWMHWRTSTFHPLLLLPEVSLVPLSLLLVPPGFLVPWVLLPLLMVLLSPWGHGDGGLLCHVWGHLGHGHHHYGREKVVGRVGIMGVSIAAKDQDWGTTVSLVLPPLCAPIYPCSNAQVSPVSWCFVILCWVM